MAIKLVQGITAEWWSPEPESDDETVTRSNFKLMPLTQIQLAECIDGLKDNIVSMAGLKRAFQIGVIDWKGIENANGSEAEFSEQAKWELPAVLMRRLGHRVILNSMLEAEDSKN